MFPISISSVVSGLKSLGFAYAARLGLMHDPVSAAIIVSSVSQADQCQEPLFAASVGSATSLVSHQQPPQQTFLHGPIPSQLQAASSAGLSTQTQPFPTVFSDLNTSPSTTRPLSRASSWDTTLQATDDQGYSSPLIDLYPV